MTGIWDLEQKKVSSWNFILAFILFGAIIVALLSSVIDLQIVQGADYSERSQNNQIKTSYVYPHRGVIFDRDGRKLAENVAATNLVLEIEPFYDDEGLNIKELTPILDKIGTITKDKWKELRPAREAEVQIEDLKGYVTYMIERLEKKEGVYARYGSILLAADLDNETTIDLKAAKDELPGVMIEEGYKRYYPEGAYFSHLLGYTSIVTAEDLEDLQYLGYDDSIAFNGFKDVIGRLGIEAVYDEQLIGKKGVSAKEKVTGVERMVEPVVDGLNLYTSIDIDAQKKMQDLLVKAVEERDATGASGIVMDVDTGELIVMVSTPSYDNNDFVGGVAQATYDKLLNDPKIPLLNRSIAAQLPPGSTFKTLSATGGLASGAIDTNTLYTSRSGYTFSNGAPFQEYRGNSYGTLNVVGALSVSSNIFFCEMIRNWDINELAPYYEMFGIGSVTGVDLVGEMPGRVPSPANKIALSKIPGITWLEPVWYPEGDGCNSVIGQGIALVTPIQMVNWISAIANGGVLNTPHIGNYFVQKDGGKVSIDHTPIRQVDVSDDVLSVVRKGMREAVAGSRRSIWALTDAKVDVAAKTGTAEFGALNEKGIYEHTHAWVTGFFPYEKPKYAFVLLLEDGGESYQAAEVAREYIDWWIQNMK